jgi:hypothetical protein
MRTKIKEILQELRCQVMKKRELNKDMVKSTDFVITVMKLRIGMQNMLPTIDQNMSYHNQLAEFDASYQLFVATPSIEPKTFNTHKEGDPNMISRIIST